jgi:hypothetical protein
MLGDVISQGQGKRTGRRVICTEPIFKVEVSFEETAKILGVDAIDIGTYVSHPKPDGSLHGLGEGVIATVEGEVVTWTGIGVGKQYDIEKTGEPERRCRSVRVRRRPQRQHHIQDVGVEIRSGQREHYQSLIPATCTAAAASGSS